MQISWTPWFNVPLHRRLELFSVGFLMFCALGLGIFSSVIILYILYAGNIYLKAICLLYLAFIYYDRESGDNGGRGAGLSWLRGLAVWKYCIDYFPIDLVKTVDLPADKNYLICFFPHGILSIGTLLTFNTGHSKWSTLFPGIRSKCATLAMNLLIPVSRELLLSSGVCSASANSLRTLMQQSNDPKDKSNQDGYTSNAVALMVGGAQESFHAVPNSYKCVLKNRKGFVKIALKSGASLVPALSFGENGLYDLIEPGSKGRLLQNLFKRYTKVAPVHFNGRGILQYNFGLIPKREAVTIVIGAPIQIDKIAVPTDDDINKYHDIFCKELRELFEKHKAKYVQHPDNVQLEII